MPMLAAKNSASVILLYRPFWQSNARSVCKSSGIRSTRIRQSRLLDGWGNSLLRELMSCLTFLVLLSSSAFLVQRAQQLLDFFGLRNLPPVLYLGYSGLPDA